MKTVAVIGQICSPASHLAHHTRRVMTPSLLLLRSIWRHRTPISHITPLEIATLLRVLVAIEHASIPIELHISWAALRLGIHPPRMHVLGTSGLGLACWVAGVLRVCWRVWSNGRRVDVTAPSSMTPDDHPTAETGPGFSSQPVHWVGIIPIRQRPGRRCRTLTDIDDGQRLEKRETRNEKEKRETEEDMTRLDPVA
jgi:hypothetical protein